MSTIYRKNKTLSQKHSKHNRHDRRQDTVDIKSGLSYGVWMIDNNRQIPICI